MHQILQFGKRHIPYTLIESPGRKSLNIAVENGEVLVTIPTGIEENQYQSILHKKAPWILKQLAYFEEMHSPPCVLQFVSGEKLPYLGRYYRLKVHKEENHLTASFRFYRGQFVAIVPQNTSPESYRDLIYPLYQEWITEKGKLFVEKRMPRFVQRLGKSPNHLLIRNMEKRWGSCTPKGSILLNWRIFLAPVSIVDYVLAHELAHLKIMNHTPAYWDTLRMLLPDYEERKDWLRINGGQLSI
ncbi:M48 family metallopeptidase [Paenibacillus glucanolyticus]|uniref:M48 family metallopeptidase n=1 Tax=Paenibacillus glucanolyticus TaxID=59843 RepID=UPI0035DA1142